MTLVLAAKFDEGVLFSYDKLLYDTDSFEQIGMRKKVSIIGRLAVGTAGIIDFENIKLEFIHANNFLKKLSDEKEDNEIKTMFLALGAKTLRRKNNPNKCPETYLIGFINKNQPRLFSFDDSIATFPIEKDYGGIGSGMYSEVKKNMKEKYRKNESLDYIAKMLYDEMQIAFEINRVTNDEYKLGGLGFTIVTKKKIYHSSALKIFSS